MTLNFLFFQFHVVSITCFLLWFLAVTLFLGLIPRFVSKTGKFHKGYGSYRIFAHFSGYLLCWISKTTLKFSDSVERLIGLSIWPYSRLLFLTAKQYKAKSAKGKRHGAKFRGNQAQASNNSFLIESYRMCLILPILNCENICEMSAKDTH